MFVQITYSLVKTGKRSNSIWLHWYRYAICGCRTWIRILITKLVSYKCHSVSFGICIYLFFFLPHACMTLAMLVVEERAHQFCGGGTTLRFRISYSEPTEAKDQKRSSFPAQNSQVILGNVILNSDGLFQVQLSERDKTDLQFPRDMLKPNFIWEVRTKRTRLNRFEFFERHFKRPFFKFLDVSLRGIPKCAAFWEH